MRKPLLALAAIALASPAYAGTPTTNYGFSKPTVSADADTWGTQLNADLDQLDAITWGKCDLAGGVQVAASGSTPGTAGCVFTGTPTLAVGTTLLAPLKFQPGTNLTSPVAGAVEWDGANLYITQAGPTRRTLAFIDGTNISASTTGSAATLTTGRTIGMTGDVAWTSASFNGSANVTGTASIQAGAVTAADIASGAAVSNIGYTPANKAGDTFTGKLNTKASASGGAGLNIAPGAAPASPSNGDCWLTASIVACEVNGSTLTLGAVGATGLLASNDLSDVQSAATARTNLGLGTAAVDNTGTSGGNVPLLNGANTWSGAQTFSSGVSVSSSLTLPSNSVTNTFLAAMAADTLKCNATGSSATPADCSPSTVAGLLVGTVANTLAAGNDSRFNGPTQNAKSANYTLALTDAGGQVYHPTADTTARTWTIPANSSVAFAVGAKVELVNDCAGGAITLNITTDTLEWFPSGTTGSRSIAACGMATLTKLTTTEWSITGVGVS